MKFDECIEAHLEWRMRLRAVLDTGSAARLSAEDVGADDRCDLGRWLHGAGLRYRDRAAFDPLVAVHREFHETAARALARAEQGNRMEAEAILAGEYSRLSAAVVSAIVELRRSVGGDPSVW